MGLKFFENSGAYEGKTYHCATCQIYLSSKAEIVSTAFRGVTGDAILFKAAKNVSFGRMEEREMLTGKHYVRDVFCGSCSEHLGWTYELAVDQREQYKEGCIILERLHIIESDDNGVLPDRPVPVAIQRANGIANPARHPDYARHHRRLFAIYRDRNNGGLAVPYFRRDANGALPQVSVYSEISLMRLFETPQQFHAFYRSLRRFNGAVQKCCDEGHNRELLAMGFNRDVAVGYANVREMMEQGRFTPTRLGDRDLKLMFDEMRVERRRLDAMDIPFDDIIVGMHDFQDELAAARRRAEAVPNDPAAPPAAAAAATMAAVLGDPQAIREVLRERIEDYGFNGALADDDLIFRRRPPGNIRLPAGFGERRLHDMMFHNPEPDYPDRQPLDLMDEDGDEDDGGVRQDGLRWVEPEYVPPERRYDPLPPEWWPPGYVPPEY